MTNKLALIFSIAVLTACGSKNTEFSVASSGTNALEDDVEVPNSEEETEEPQLEDEAESPESDEPVDAAEEKIHYINVVSGTGKASCDQLVVATREKYGILSGVSSCYIGGGCSKFGGPPTATNPSANPTLYGACLGPISWQQILDANGM